MSSPERTSPADLWLPITAGIAALAPLVLYQSSFAELWWFGDDWDLLDQIARTGLLKWSMQVFAENFVPLFKLLWGTAVLTTGGSYLPMVYLLWVTHAVNVGLFSRLLRRANFGWPGTLVGATVFGLTATNIETLAWSVQWSAILATTFFLLAAAWYLRQRPELGAWDWKVHGVLVALVSASALSFSRGILSGVVLAFVSLLPAPASPWNWRYRLRTSALCLAPAALVAVLIWVFATGNHHNLTTGSKPWILSAIEFGSWYWCLAPLQRIVTPDTWGPHTTVVLGIAKLALVFWGLWQARGIQFRALATFALLDLGNAALLGIGRYHTGLEAANGSRYQYAALICTLPFLAFAFDRALGTIAPRPFRIAAAGLLVGLAGLHVARPWPREIDAFAAWRGRGVRELLREHPNPPAENAVPGIPFLPTHRAKELIKHYNLH